MSMFTTADQHARVLRRRLLYAVVGVGLVVAAIVIGLTGLGVDREDPTDTPPGTDASTAAPTEPATPGTGGWVVPPVSAGPLILPQPAGTVRGVPVGFPHTVPGAISAAARYAETAVGLDETRARTLGEVAAAPYYPSAADEFALGVRGLRASLGLVDGETTPGAYVVFQAKAYRVVDASPDRVVVEVLGVVDAAGPATAGQGRRATSVIGYELAWVDADWRLAAPRSTGEPDTLPAPGSTQAYQGGWRDLTLE